MPCYYVYLHRKKTTGEVFYVGKGSGKRAWDNHGRSDPWRKTVSKHGKIVEILQDNLQEWYAFELEADMISLHGRRDLGSGPLVNLADGGQGPGEEGHPNCDLTIYTFYNVDTNETIRSTRVNFRRMFPESNLSGLFLRVLKSEKRWVVLELVTEDEIEAVRTSYRGKYGKSANLEKYDFTNLHTGEVVNCDRHELNRMYPDLKVNSITRLINGESRTCAGWVIASTLLTYSREQLLNPISGIRAGLADKNVYTFKNILTEEVFTGTRSHFIEKYGIPVYTLFTKTKINYKTKNWCLLENEHLARRNTSSDTTVYSLISENGERFTGTRQEFKHEYGFTFHSLVDTKSPCKTCKGWRLTN